MMLITVFVSTSEPVLADVNYPEKCLKSWMEGSRTYVQNQCDHYVYVIYCEKQGRKERKACSVGNNYYRLASSIRPGEKFDFWGAKNVRYGACGGMRGMSQEWKDWPDGRYSCGKVKRPHG